MRLLNYTLQLQAVLLVAGSLLLAACTASPPQRNNVQSTNTKNWQEQFHEKVTMLGHRNWILVVDKAFPEQNSPGMEYLYANEGLSPVLKVVLDKVNQSIHVKPLIYQDKELAYITEEQAKGVTQFRKDLQSVLSGQDIRTMLHDSVFKKLDGESKLFNVLVIKTNEQIPYTSVFLQLDCAYWNGIKENQMRLKMSKEKPLNAAYIK